MKATRQSTQGWHRDVTRCHGWCLAVRLVILLLQLTTPNTPCNKLADSSKSSFPGLLILWGRSKQGFRGHQPLATVKPLAKHKHALGLARLYLGLRQRKHCCVR
jgi:hypothetical protein